MGDCARTEVCSLFSFFTALEKITAVAFKGQIAAPSPGKGSVSSLSCSVRSVLHLAFKLLMDN